MAKEPKTQGLEWLLISLSSFNGSGYADMDSPQDFLNSYKAYKAMHNKQEAVHLATVYEPEALSMLRDLLEHTNGPSRYPTPKNMAKFEKFKHTYLTQGTLL